MPAFDEKPPIVRVSGRLGASALDQIAVKSVYAAATTPDATPHTAE